MGFTRKVLEKKSDQADYGAQLAYFELPPPMGVLGVNRDDLIDIDESGVWLCVCRRVRGHAPRGQSAATHSPYNEGKKYTVIMAIDTAGVLAYQLSDLPGTTTETFFQFMRALMPCLVDRRRVIVMDNLKSHKSPETKWLVEGNGHVIVFRPSYSSDVLGSIEYAFNIMKAFLRHYAHDITQANLPEYTEAAICSISGDNCRGLFAHTGHFVEPNGAV